MEVPETDPVPEMLFAAINVADVVADTLSPSEIAPAEFRVIVEMLDDIPPPETSVISPDVVFNATDPAETVPLLSV